MINALKSVLRKTRRFVDRQILKEYAFIVAGRSKRNLLVRATVATLIKKVLTGEQIRIVHKYIRTGK